VRPVVLWVIWLVKAQELAATTPFRGLERLPELEALAASGRRQEALALTEAEALYRDMGMPKHLAMTQALFMSSAS
jgi:hypothetical protein